MKYIKIKNGKEEISVGKIVCVGRNYTAHAKELGNEVPEFPIIFMKPATTLITTGEEIIHPDYSNDMHHEVELVLLIGNTVKNVDDKAAEDAIAGYAVGLDMTLRDLQNELKKKGHPWELAKSFDTCAVASEFISKKEYSLMGDEKIMLSINGQLKQNSTLNYMIFSPVEIVKYISSKITLHKGDLIYTGTPEGVGKVNRGDIISAEIENIGKLELKVI
ncbi:MAG: 2-oxopent-4-enoate hydratase [Ignavibacteria bacterium RBG_13_36_8]|nr:MAG: 2-oxopent-4-enoate hydratase [Ignavibacteria bacterium RBG_13_36_8]